MRGRHAPPLRRLRIDVERVEPCRPRIRAEVDPDALDLDPAAAVSGRSDQRRPAAIAAVPLHQVTTSTSRSPRNGASTSIRTRRMNQVLRRAPARLADVLDGRVLEQPRDGVEPQPAARVEVGEAGRVAP